MKNYFSYKCRAECYLDIEALITLIIPTLLSFNVVRINENSACISVMSESKYLIMPIRHEENIDKTFKLI
jgi:hypothetical protein